jgi:disulfide bond formation protein DsbB
MPSFSKFSCLLVLVLLGVSTLLPVGLLDEKPVYWTQVPMSWLGLGSLFLAALIGFLQSAKSITSGSNPSKFSMTLGATLVFAVLGLLGSLAPLVLLDGLKVGEDVTPVTIAPESYGFWLVILALAMLA